jgi:hypothetical protein
MKEEETIEGEVVSFSTPRLNALEKLYVRVYLATFSHPKAYEAVNPGLSKYTSANPYSSRENVKFHISLKLQERAEALSLTPDIILSQLYKEATREGAGSNHAARIQALQILGKHLGMFVEKREDASHVIQIINYGSTETKDLVDHIKQEVIEEHNSFDSLPDNISFIEYNDDNT